MAESALVPLEKLDPAKTWKPWQPDTKQPFDLKAAGHLYRRAAFGGSLAELRQAVKQGFSATLDRLLDGETGVEKRLAFLTSTGELIAGQGNANQLRGWWLYTMLHSLHPLREKLTLFWHDHFATSINKVTSTQMMFKQNLTLRKHSLGKFEPFVQSVSKDPAMLIYLDANGNIKGKPNENYARELMELFTLGVGNYTEQDIRQAARAFTGWQTDDESQFSFDRDLHDDGDKTIFGKSGKFDGEDVVRLCLDKPACALFITRKLYRFYISDTQTPPEKFLAPLTEAFRKSDYDIKALVRQMLGSRHFFSAHAYRQKIKSPVDLAVGAIWTLTSREVPQTALVPKLEDMGQALFAPPNVKGWPGGTNWLNTSTILARHNFAQAVAAGTLKGIPERRRGRFAEFEEAEAQRQLAEEEARRAEEEARAKATGKPVPPKVEPPPPPPPANLDLMAIVRAEKATTPEAIVAVLLDALVQGDVAAAAKAELIAFVKKGNPKGADLERRARDAAHMIMTMPEYQLS
jgi:hypothetical protein